jgi:hypothetical protein
MVELPQKIRPAFKAGLIQPMPVKRLSGSMLCREVLAQNAQRARPKRQQQQRARNHRRGLGNNNQLILNSTRVAKVQGTNITTASKPELPTALNSPPLP